MPTSTVKVWFLWVVFYYSTRLRKHCLKTCSWTTLAEISTKVESLGYAWQSSSYEGGDADKAIDGNKDVNFYHGSCTHKLTQHNPWWTVDLNDMYWVNVVTITNRADRNIGNQFLFIQGNVVKKLWFHPICILITFLVWFWFECA